MPYFIIHNGEGDTTVERVSKDVLLKRIQPEEGENCGDYGDVEFLSEIENIDTNYWDEKLLIIKGEIVTPTLKKVVTEFDIE